MPSDAALWPLPSNRSVPLVLRLDPDAVLDNICNCKSAASFSHVPFSA